MDVRTFKEVVGGRVRSYWWALVPFDCSSEAYTEGRLSVDAKGVARNEALEQVRL